MARSKAVVSYRFEILSWNLWHGLNHNQPYLMFPLQNPWTLLQRYQAHESALDSWVRAVESEGESEGLTLIGLQEVNPALQRMARFGKKLNMKPWGRVSNGGIKRGLIGYPFFLNEGLGLLAPHCVQGSSSESITLSGSQARLPGIGIEFNLAEHRSALSVQFVWKDLRIRFATTHLHHGDPRLGASRRRRLELTSLAEWLNDRYPHDDLQILSGDFNCSAGMDEFDGFVNEGAWLSDPSSPATWDPPNNPLTKATTLNSGPIDHSWESSPRSLDQILIRFRDSKLSLQGPLKTDLAMTSPPLSDHFALRARFQLQRSP
jgi:endonuclease/exonuclease/phosphatase family metal-dependent hydrolase